MVNEKKQKVGGVILTYLIQAVKIITGLIYTPVMLTLVGQNEYGVYQIADSMISYLSLINLGLLGAYAKFYISAQKKSQKAVNETNGVFMILLLLLSFTCIVAGIALVKNLHLLFGQSLTSTEYALLSASMKILIVNMAITFPAGLFEHNITVNEKFIVIKLIVFFKTLLNPFISLPLLIYGFGTIGLVTTTTVLTIGATIVEVIYCLYELNMRFSISKKAFFMLRTIGGFTFFIFLNQIIDMINWNIGKVLIGRYLGSSAVAVYSVGAQLRRMYSEFPNAIRTVFQPQMYKMVAENRDDKEINSLFMLTGRIQCFILTPILIGFICLGKQFVKLWAGYEYQTAYYVALCMMIPIAIPHIQDIGIDLQRAKNKHSVRSIVYFIIAIINVCIAVPLIKNIGIVGAAMSTGISLVLGQGIFMNFYYKKIFNLNISEFWKQIGEILFPQIIIGFIYWHICSASSINNWIIFALYVAVYLLLYLVSLWLLGFNNIEKERIKKILTRNRL